MTSVIEQLRAANDNLPLDNDGSFIMPLDGDLTNPQGGVGESINRNPYKVIKSDGRPKCCPVYRAPKCKRDIGQADPIICTGRAPTETERINSGKVSPLDRAFTEKRIDQRLAYYADTVNRAWQIAHGHGGTASPKSVAPGVMIGVEINANAAMALRLIKYRTGPLYGPLIDACVHAVSMAEIGRRHFTESKLDKGQDAKVGTSKVIDALRLARGAIDDLNRWAHDDDLTPAERLRKALCSDRFPEGWHIAANDDVRRIETVAA